MSVYTREIDEIISRAVIEAIIGTLDVIQDVKLLNQGLPSGLFIGRQASEMREVHDRIHECRAIVSRSKKNRAAIP